jgi:hypothetical protein
VQRKRVAYMSREAVAIEIAAWALDQLDIISRQRPRGREDDLLKEWVQRQKARLYGSAATEEDV